MWSPGWPWPRATVSATAVSSARSRTPRESRPSHGFPAPTAGAAVGADSGGVCSAIPTRSRTNRASAAAPEGLLATCPGGSGGAGPARVIRVTPPADSGITRCPPPLCLVVTNIWDLTVRRHIDLCRVASQACR
ncbi:putative leader peptide [Streptomonospora salina]|uniref:putative leader peptide n=1 Tax=Streptomonospora salina TaxID=104205 RepID=UPI0035E44C92